MPGVAEPIEILERLSIQEDPPSSEEVEAINTAKKKKRRPRKKGASSNTQENGNKEISSMGYIPSQDNSMFRLLNDWKEKRPSKQTEPPTVPISQLYSIDPYPTGEVQLYSSYKSEAEARELERLAAVDIEGLREAAECHRQVRRYVQSFARPGISLIDLCQRLEAKTMELIGASNSEPKLKGKGFPTGCSLNNCAAHYTPNMGDETLLTEKDICKLDFGVQVRGRIIDCAFTIAFDPMFDNLIKSTQDGTNVGLKHAGVDARISEIGGYIQETIESYEVEIEGKTYPVKAIKNLTGHSIAPYRIHAGKSVPIVKSSDRTSSSLNIMEEGEVFAIETFASTGRGQVGEGMECSHYMKSFDCGFTPLRLKSAKDLLKLIDDNFGTLAFCRRWIHDLGATSHLLALKHLVERDIIVPYPPLCDIAGSYTSQMEHTVYIGSTKKEILSRGDDF